MKFLMHFLFTALKNAYYCILLIIFTPQQHAPPILKQKKLTHFYQNKKIYLYSFRLYPFVIITLFNPPSYSQRGTTPLTTLYI